MDCKQLDIVKLEKQDDSSSSSEWLYFDPGRLWDDDQHYLYNGYQYQQDNNYTFFSNSSSSSSLDYYHYYYDHHHHHQYHHNFQFDPFSDFQWEFVDFPVIDHNFQTKDSNNNNNSNNNVQVEEFEGGDDAGMMINDGRRGRGRGREGGDHQMGRSGRSSSKSGVELEEIQKYFNVPITKAAKELKIGLTVLKKRCRELNIMRWPHRKIKSLNALIHNFKEMGVCRKEIEMLEHHKRMLEKEPELDLSDRTKRLRQACFKLNYKKRRTNSLLSSSSSSS